MKGFVLICEICCNYLNFQVIVSLPYAEYGSLAPLEVPMTVAANIILQPSEVYLMAGDYIQYTVHIVSLLLYKIESKTV